MNIEGPGRGSVASIGWIRKEVRLKVGGGVGQRGQSVRLELHLLGVGTVFSCCVLLRPNT